MGRTSTARERLIDAGCDLLHSRGYSALGVADICAAADVRKGSFYHFFESKQVLAVEVVRSAWQVQRQDWTRALSADEPALTRLQRLLELQAETQRADKTTTGALRGCLFGNLAQEMNQDTAVSAAVSEVFDDQIDSFSRPSTRPCARAASSPGAPPRRTHAPCWLSSKECSCSRNWPTTRQCWTNSGHAPRRCSGSRLPERSSGTIGPSLV